MDVECQLLFILRSRSHRKLASSGIVGCLAGSPQQETDGGRRFILGPQVQIRGGSLAPAECTVPAVESGRGTSADT
jgi:hypothetical protein